MRRPVRCIIPIGKAHTEYWEHDLGSDMPMYFMPYAVDNYFSSPVADPAAKRST
ncbi:MAG TPA: hypothetical protein VK604_17055 [Bryobacteraceae bacterium]|nr:hypothetical protein [Bryobacteraceae bacterium]